MRIRSTKPEFWRSRRISSVDWEARLVLKALESYVDDNGVGKDDLALIVSDTFPRDLAQEPSGTLKRVQAAMVRLQTAGLLWRYEADGNELIYIAFWESTQYINRPSKGRLPRPDGTFEYGDSEIGAPDQSPQEPSVLEQGTGNRGTGGQTTSPPPTASKSSGTPTTRRSAARRSSRNGRHSSGAVTSPPTSSSTPPACTSRPSGGQENTPSSPRTRSRG